MRVDDYFVDDPVSSLDGAFDFDLLDRLRSAPLRDHSGLEAAIALAQLLDQEFESYGTDSKHSITEAGSKEALRTLRAVTTRLGVTFEPPFRDFPSFRAYWGSHGGYGSWAARRAMVEPISPRKVTGWPAVHLEIAELRRHFHTATTPQDYRNIGNDVVSVLEALSAAAYEPSRHLFEGETEPTVTETKNRLTRVIEVDCNTQGGAELRRHARSTIELAQAVKHNRSGTRTQAGIAADAAIQLANMIRRIQENLGAGAEP